MYLVKENDIYIREREKEFENRELITFRLPSLSGFWEEKYDWYLTVALEKSDKVTVDRNLLTRELLLGYRWAIREGYQHQLDPNLRNEYDYPRNQNTIAGIRGYIEKIKKISEIEYK